MNYFQVKERIFDWLNRQGEEFVRRLLSLPPVRDKRNSGRKEK